LFLLPKEASDRLALEGLFTSCGGAGWKKKGGWMADAGLGECSVIMLDLHYNNLAGPLPSGLQQLSAPWQLDLCYCKLTGPIPAELGQFGALTTLRLYDNQQLGPGTRQHSTCKSAPQAGRDFRCKRGGGESGRGDRRRQRVSGA
jgi:hypothetical protein